MSFGPTIPAVPDTSTLNTYSSQNTANGITVALNAGNLQGVWVGLPGTTSDVIFDVTGYFTNDGSAGGQGYHPITPLRMGDTRFEVEPHMASRLAAVKIRGEDGKFGDFEIAPPSRPEFYGMGHSLYSTAPDYMRFLRMYLNKGSLDGARILSEKGLAAMLANQIGDIPIPPLKTAVPAITADAEFFPGKRKSHSMAFMRFEEDIPGMRRAGSQGWAGVLNTHYWWDPVADLAGVLMTQSLPFVEPRFV